MNLEPSLHLVDADGQAEAVCPHCADAEKELRDKRSHIKRLKTQLSNAMGLEPEAEDVRDVLKFHRDYVAQGSVIVVGSDGWKAVRERLRDTDAITNTPAFSVLKLKAACVGVMLSDFHVENRRKGYLRAASIFGDAEKVQAHITRAIGFKRRKGVSALTLLDELGGKALSHLALRCSCEHLWIDHVRAFPRSDGLQPCASCECETFDYFAAKLDRFTREQDAA